MSRAQPMGTMLLGTARYPTADVAYFVLKFWSQPSVKLDLALVFPAVDVGADTAPFAGRRSTCDSSIFFSFRSQPSVAQDLRIVLLAAAFGIVPAVAFWRRAVTETGHTVSQFDSS